MRKNGEGVKLVIPRSAVKNFPSMVHKNFNIINFAFSLIKEDFSFASFSLATQKVSSSSLFCCPIFSLLSTARFSQFTLQLNAHTFFFFVSVTLLVVGFSLSLCASSFSFFWVSIAL
ncbi:hypothetical protein Dimus_001773 [Dionaea muscipula]